jgi:membrane protease YdiL (CAAX protease family)
MRTGLGAGIPLATAAVLGAFLPLTSRFFQEERIVRASPGEAARELLVQIPLATAISEEVIFRSSLEAILSRRRSPVLAAAISAAVFGAWHILPALDRAMWNPAVSGFHHGSKARQAMVPLGVCAFTTIAGLLLSGVRSRSRSIIAPILVHYAANAGSFLGGWLAARRSRI